MTKVTLTGDMPIQVSAELARRLRGGERVVVVKRMPADIFVDAHERQSETNHRQTLEQIRARAGFDAVEMVAILSCQPFKVVGNLSEEAAHRILYAWQASFNRGQRVAEGVA